jgi:hypothetical protein
LRRHVSITWSRHVRQVYECVVNGVQMLKAHPHYEKLVASTARSALRLLVLCLAELEGAALSHVLRVTCDHYPHALDPCAVDKKSYAAVVVYCTLLTIQIAPPRSGASGEEHAAAPTSELAARLLGLMLSSPSPHTRNVVLPLLGEFAAPT